MLKIKLARFGKRGQPHFRIVVNEDKDKRDGRYVELLGHYAPAAQPKELVIDTALYQAWIKKGAQPTDTVAALFERSQSKVPFPTKKAQPNRKQIARTKAAADAAAQPPVEEKPAAETTAVEAPVAEVEAADMANTKVETEVAPEVAPETADAASDAPAQPAESA